jgi:hypothetical protein
MRYLDSFMAGSLALIILLGAGAWCIELDIDYSHTIEGSGTVLTDYNIGTKQSSETTGSVRGTGEVMNKYSFSSNGTALLTVEDEFTLSKVPTATKTVLPSYPKWPANPERFRLTGMNWIQMAKASGNSTNNSASNDTNRISDQEDGASGSSGLNTTITSIAKERNEPSEL